MTLFLQCLIAGAAGGASIFCISQNAGHIADRSYKAILYQPLIAILWIIGIKAVVSGFWPCVAYVIGCTIGSTMSIILRKRGK